MTENHALAIFGLLLVVLGLWYRRTPEKHVPLMATAFLIDLLLLVRVELAYHALENVVSGSSGINPSLFWTHIIVSTLTGILYCVLIGSGVRLYRGRKQSRKLHFRAAKLFCILKLLNVLTSFMI